MQTIRRLAFLLFFVTSPLFAQSLTVSPGGTLQGGSHASLTYVNSSRAGQTIVVTVTGGSPTTTQEVVIHLDDTGRGTGSWSVPTTWDEAAFSAPDVVEQVVPIS